MVSGSLCCKASLEVAWLGELIINRLPPLNSLKCFESAARHGSFNKAAQELNVTPSAISHQIKGLESFLGIELFRRTKRKVVLTEAGETYLKPIKQIFQKLEQAIGTRDYKQINTYMQKYAKKIEKMKNPSPNKKKILEHISMNLRDLREEDKIDY